MQFPVDLGSSFFKNLDGLDFLNDEKFSVFINDEEVILPLLVAALISSKILKLIKEDNTIRKFDIKMEFVNTKSKRDIISLLTSRKQVSMMNFQNAKEIFDFAKFGSIFGNESFIKPLESLIKKWEDEGIKIENALRLIEAKDILSFIQDEKVDVEKELSFISSNFCSFKKRMDFINWWTKKGNEERVEKIVKNENLHLDNEDDLFSFITKINNEGNRFIHLYSYVHLEFCTVESCKQLINMIKKNDILQSKHYRDSVLTCISKKLLFNPFIDIKANELNERYSQETVKSIMKRNNLQTRESPKNVVNKKKKVMCFSDETSDSDEFLIPKKSPEREGTIKDVFGMVFTDSESD